MTELPIGMFPAPNTPPAFDYTSRDYTSIRDHLIDVIRTRVPEWNPSNDADFGMALVEMQAYLGDMVHYAIDRVGNEAYLPTATLRKNVLNHAYLLGYSPGWPVSAEGQVTLTCASDGSNVVVPKGTVVVASIADAYGDYTSIPFETTQDVTVTGTIGSAQTVGIIHGRTVNDTGHGELIAVSDGSPDQSVVITNTPVAWGSLEIWTFDGTAWTLWTQVDHLIDYTASSLVYTAHIQEDDSILVEFGDGVNGAIPPNTHQITARYRVGGGTVGNIPASSINSLEDSVLNTRLSITNDFATSGGANSESTAAIRENASLAYRSNDRAVTADDVIALARNVSGVRHANVDAAVWSNVNLVIAPSDDSSLHPGLTGATGVAYGGGAGTDRITGADTAAQGTLKTNVTNSVTPSMMMGSSLTLRSPEYPRVSVALTVNLMDGVPRSRAKVDITSVLVDGLLSYERGFGTSVTMADVIVAVTNSANYITSINVTDLHRKDQYSTAGVQVTQAAWYEILMLSESDLTLTITGGVNDL